MSLRDANVVIIENDRTNVRAGLGLHDLLKTPSVDILARAGLRKSSSGEFLNKSLQPIPSSSSLLPRRDRQRYTAYPQFSVTNASVNDYLVGAQLDDAIAAGQDVAISWPFADADVYDWTQAEAIWKYILFNQLQRRRAQNESPVLLSIAAGLSRTTYERICQIFFERFNVAGFGILERPMAQMYSANSLSGVVIDIGEERTDITPIYENFIVHQACTSTPIGARDCRAYLANILRSNQSIVSTLSPESAPLEPEQLDAKLHDLIKQLWREGHIKIPSDGETAVPEDEGVTDIAAVLVAGKEKAVIENGLKKKATLKASAAEQARAREIEALDLLTIQFQEYSLTVGKERHRLCEPLFDPSLVAGLKISRDESEPPSPVQNAVAHALSRVEFYQRQYVWAGVLVTGDLTRHVKGLSLAMQSRLAPYVANPELQTDVQARHIRLLSLPEYYPEYRDTGNGYAAFLGTSIIAKIVFNDSGGKNFVTKLDYSTKGPRSIIEMTPALL